MMSDAEFAFDAFADARTAINTEQSRLVVVVLAVDWCAPALHTGRTARDMEQRLGDVRVFVVNEEDNRDYCARNGVVVGTPALLVYFRGSGLVFRRDGWPDSTQLIGPLNDDELRDVLVRAMETSRNIKTTNLVPVTV